MNYETIIGLEVHAQLLTRSKMYCRCSTEYASAPPNTHVCPVCLGLPGVLPVINRKAIEFTIMTALALNCTIPDYSKFDRKNYPYPDLMKGYQISQYDAPLGVKGWLSIDTDGERRRIGITRVHLEEDVAKLLHTSNGGEPHSLVDVNRAGAPLMEIVSEPDMRAAEEARQYLVKLRSILQYLGVSTGNMEEGSFRCDANISIRPEGTQEFMPKVEVKNMNSFRAVFRALEYEAERQKKVAAEGKRLVQETRGWVEEKGKTVSQRSKEFAHDYRYFPEPDLPPIVLKPAEIEEIRARLPELPEARRERFMAEYALNIYDATLLTNSRAMADYFEDSLKSKGLKDAAEDKTPKEIGNWLLGEVSRIVNATGTDMEAFRKRVPPAQLARLAVYSHGKISMATAKTVLEDMFNTGRDVDSIVSGQGLAQISDDRALEAQVVSVIAANPGAAADYRAGKEQSLKFLLGQVMRATKGRANPQAVGEIIKRELNKG